MTNQVSPISPTPPVQERKTFNAPKKVLTSEEIEMARITAQKDIEIARINAKKEVETQKISVERARLALEQEKLNQEIAKVRFDNTKDEEISTDMLAKMSLIVKEFHEKAIKKSGKVKSQKVNYDYFELEDILPTALEVTQDNQAYMHFLNHGLTQELRIYDYETGEFLQWFIDSPFINEGMIKGMQFEGAKETYAKRRLLVSAFHIVEKDAIEQATQDAQAPAIPKPNFTSGRKF